MPSTLGVVLLESVRYGGTAVLPRSATGTKNELLALG